MVVSIILWLTLIISLSTSTLLIITTKTQRKNLDNRIQELRGERDIFRTEVDILRQRRLPSVSSDSSKVTVDREYLHSLRLESIAYKLLLEKIENAKAQNEIDMSIRGRRLLMLDERNQDG